MTVKKTMYPNQQVEHPKKFIITLRTAEALLMSSDPKGTLEASSCNKPYLPFKFVVAESTTCLARVLPEVA